MPPGRLPIKPPITPRVRTGGGTKAGSALRANTSKAGAAANRALSSAGRGVGALFRGLADGSRRRRCDCQHPCCCQNQA